MAMGTDSDHFVWQLDNGRKFTYEELKQLTNQQKQDWVKYVAKENQQVLAYLAKTNGEVENTYNAVSEAIWDVENLHDEYKDLQDTIDVKLDQAMIKNKLKVAAKDDQFFKIFNIVDMYGKSDACWTCSKGFKCSKHGLERKDDHLKGDKEFFGKK